MDTIRNTIHQYLDKGYTCVFPNETVARFWLADYALRSEVGVIRSDRVLSWDIFRQYFLPVRKDQRPVSSLLRQLFVSRLLREMRSSQPAEMERSVGTGHLSSETQTVGTSRPLGIPGAPSTSSTSSTSSSPQPSGIPGIPGIPNVPSSPNALGTPNAPGIQNAPNIPSAPHSLRWFVPTSHPEADDRFCRSIAAILPQLSVLDDELLARLPEPMAQDLVFLQEKYTAFLSERSLFEPAYESPSIDYAAEAIPQCGPYCIMFSQAIPDCEKFLAQLGDPEWIITHNIDADDETGPCLEVFENQLQELRTQLRRIEALLERGVPARDIVVTCAGLEDFLDILQEEARLHEVPVRIVQGLSPLQYPAGRFFSSLKRVYDEQASLDSMKSLLLDPCYPWRDLPLHRRLIAKAVELRIDHGNMRNFKGGDQWHARLRRGDVGLADWYDSFKENVRDICTSSTIQMLRRQLNQFQDRFFVDEQWERILEPIVEDEPQNDLAAAASPRTNPDADVYSFCMKRIDQLDDALATGGFTDRPGLFGMFLNMLETAKYVPQQEQKGIPVYAWPLTAGMSPRYHFVMNMSHGAVQVVQCRADFIPETMGDETLRGEDDLTPAVLALYRRTDSLQDGAYLSCSRQTYTDIALPPSWFVEHGRLCPPDRGIVQAPDLFQVENTLWKGEIPATATCTHANQKRWFEQAQRGILAPVQKSLDMARSPVKDVGMLRPLYTTVDGKALLPLSATSLDLFDSCPFAWACKYLYDVDEQEFTVPPVDHRAMGNLIHSVYQRFFQGVTERSGAYNSEQLDSYRELLNEIWEDELQRLSKRPDAPSASTFAWIRYSLQKQLPAILNAEAKTFPDTLSWGYEYKLEEVDLERGYSLEGRIDRIVLLRSADGGPPSPHDAVESNGAMFAVVDYKKGTGIGPKQFNAKMEQGALASCQLPVYRKLVRTALGATVSTGAYYSVKDCRYSIIWKSDDEQAARMDDLLDEQISRLLRAVERGDLSATPSKDSCGNCMFRQVCRRRFAIQ
ncbi:MAG: PD-(D/E)XK nuclease family protein [Sphaerochaetaceae bacterium]|nr:PD-(D/E)XK nuclease family protein [Sphaerochaetaceae bacterium]